VDLDDYEHRIGGGGDQRNYATVKTFLAFQSIETVINAVRGTHERAN